MMRRLDDSEQDWIDDSVIDEAEQPCVPCDASRLSARRKIELYWEQKRLKELLEEF